MSRQRSGPIKAAVALCSVALLGACASAPPVDSVRGALIVVGSGTQEGEVGLWRNAWVEGNNNGVSVNFSPDGEDVGITALQTGNTHVATADTPLTESASAAAVGACGPGGAFSVPTSIAPVGVVYNLSGLRGLKLDASALAKIFNGTISSWDDPYLRALNPTLEMPVQEIRPVTSADESAITLAGTSYLAQNAAEMWSADASQTWPEETAGQQVEHDRDVAKEVDDQFGAIAFLNVNAIGNRFSTAALEFSDGFSLPTTENIDKAIAASQVWTADYGVAVNLASEQGAGYQLASVRYQSFCFQYPNEPIAKLVESWAAYVISEPGQAKAWIALDSYSPSRAALDAAQELVASIDHR
ncbi:substrate-binding domain-containing protein [Specibacter sp. NPDC057265]|uniref:substrate-binding domain-containing protein n=1 Tax=Specibacter sp. NPDC057265 TaxID=3346075 RepID=UPI0036259EB5